MYDSLWPTGLYSPWNSPGLNTGLGSLSLLQGIFPTQESNLSHLHCRRILYQLSFPVQFCCWVVSDSLRPHGPAHQASLPITNSWSLLKLMSIESVMPSNHLIPFPACLQFLPASGSFQMSQFSSGGESIGVSASASVFPMNIKGWFHLRWTGWISLESKELWRVFSNITVQKHQLFSAQLS